MFYKKRLQVLALLLIVLLVLTHINIVFYSKLIYFDLSQKNSRNENPIQYNYQQFHSIINLLNNGDLDFNTRFLISSFYSSLFKTDYFLLGLVATEIQLAYQGTLKLEKSAFIINTQYFNLILGHGEFINSEYKIGKITPEHFFEKNKINILAACFSSSSRILDTKTTTFSGEITIETIFNWLFLNYPTFNSKNNLVTLFFEKSLMDIRLDVTAPSMFLTLNPIIMAGLKWMMERNFIGFGINMIRTIAKLFQSLDLIGALATLVESLQGMTQFTNLIAIFLETGAQNAQEKWGKEHINHKIRENQYGQTQVNNDLISNLVFFPKPVGMYIVQNSRNGLILFDLHVIIPKSEQCKNDEKRIAFWDIVVGPSPNYQVINSILTLDKYAGCSSEQRTEQEALNHFIDKYGENKHIEIFKPIKQTD